MPHRYPQSGEQDPHVALERSYEAHVRERRSYAYSWQQLVDARIAFAYLAYERECKKQWVADAERNSSTTHVAQEIRARMAERCYSTKKIWYLRLIDATALQMQYP